MTSLPASTHSTIASSKDMTTHCNTFRAAVNNIEYVVTLAGTAGLQTDYPGDYDREDLFAYKDERNQLQWAVKLEAIASNKEELEIWEYDAKLFTGWKPEKKERWIPDFGASLEVVDPELAAIAKAARDRRTK